MNVVTYNPHNRFNSTQCAVCLDDYKESERIAELACQHLYHIQCQETFIRCPSCQMEIAGRSVPVTREELESEVTALVQQLPQVIGLSRQITPEMVQKVVDRGMEYHQNSIIKNLNILQLVKQLNSDLRMVLTGSEQERQAVINRHAFYLIEQSVQFLADKPVDETYSLKQVAENISALSMFIFEERFVKEYVQPLMKAVAESPRLIEVIQNRDMQFKDEVKVKLQSMNIWQKCRHIKQYTPRQLEIIADLKVAKTATKIISVSKACMEVSSVIFLTLGMLFIMEPEGTTSIINAATGNFTSSI